MTGDDEDADEEEKGGGAVGAAAAAARVAADVDCGEDMKGLKTTVVAPLSTKPRDVAQANVAAALPVVKREELLGEIAEQYAAAVVA